MSLDAFGKVIGRRLAVEPIGKAWRCYFPDILYADKSARDAVAVTVIGCGPNRQRMREDFAQKIRGKFARTPDGCGGYREYPVPLTLAA